MFRLVHRLLDSQPGLPRRSRLGLLSLLIATCAALAADMESTPRIFEVATWNIWGLPPPLAPGRSWRLPKIHQALRDSTYDVVGLQEVWKGSKHLMAGPRMLLPRNGADSGLAIYTPYDATAPVVRYFADGSGADSFKGKGALITEVVVPEMGEMTFVASHLQAGRGKKASRVRSQQVDELLGWLEAVDGPVVLLGDFNLELRNPVDHAAAERMREAGFTDTAAATHHQEDTHRDGGRLDRILVRGELYPCTVHIVKRPALSDHHALVAKLGWGSPEQCSAE